MGKRETPGTEGPIGESDPTEEVGPEECEARRGDTEFRAGSLEEKPDGSHPKFAEELQDAYQPMTEVMVPHPIDGLPTPADERSDLATAPPFTYETVVCVEDARQWVEVFAGEDERSEHCESTSLSYNYGNIRWHSRWTDGGLERERRQVEPDLVFDRFGIKITPVETPEGEKGDWFMPVRPIRPVCRHYKRQVFSNDDVPNPADPGHKIVFRNCMKRLSVGGAAMSLRDEAVYACDHREPQDLVSLRKHLDDPDKKRLESEAHKVLVPLFNTSQE